jgi:hypothetical protein
MKYIFCILVLFLFGCVSTAKVKNKCRRMCETNQEDNVGSQFEWSDLDATFGKCICVSLSGSIKSFI